MTSRLSGTNWFASNRRNQSGPHRQQPGRRKTRRRLPSALVRQVEAAVAEGAYSKGLSLLSGASKLAPLNAGTVARLRTLQPRGASIHTSSKVHSPFGESGLTSKQVLRQFRGFKPLSAPGPSSLRHTHLLEAADVPSVADKNRLKGLLVRWVDASASGDLPSWCGRPVNPPRKALRWSQVDCRWRSPSSIDLESPAAPLLRAACGRTRSSSARWWRPGRHRAD